MLNKNLKGDIYLYTDETKIEIGSYAYDSIRSKKKIKKIKKEEQVILDLINRPQKKFELTIMIARAICHNGLTNLIFLEGLEN